MRRTADSVAADDLLGGEVHGERLRANHGFLSVRRHRAALGRAQTREQLSHPEGFGDVVVGPGIERVDLLGLLLARRQHDDRDGGPRPKAADHLDTVDAGQARGPG